MLLLLLSLLAGPAAPQDHCNVPNSDKYDCAPFEADCIAKVGGDPCTGRHHDPHVVFTHCLDEPSVIWSVMQVVQGCCWVPVARNGTTRDTPWSRQNI